jgi:HEPN domain-containing protein
MSVERARSMLRLAGMDMNAASILGESGKADAEIIGFHLQQAAEKALKAWLLLLAETPPRTHDLDYLLHRLAAHSEDVAAFRSLDVLNPFAVQFRYDIPDPEPFDWRTAINDVARLLEHVRGLAGEDTQ